MKKLFAVLMVLSICGTANATMISLVDEGTVIDASLTGGVVKLEITSDTSLAVMNLIVVLTGDGIFSDAMGSCYFPICPWDPISMPPIYHTPQRVEIGGGTMGAPVVGNAGWVEVTYSGPVDVVVSLEGDGLNGGTFDGGYAPVSYSSGVVTIIPEPATIALLGLGGLALLRRRK